MSNRPVDVILLHLGTVVQEESGVDAAEVGFAVADAEGEVVDVGDARAGVGVGALR